MHKGGVVEHVSADPWKTPDPLPSRPEPEGSAPGGAGHGTPDFSPRDHRPLSQQVYAAIKDLVKCLQRITQRMTQRVPFLIHQNLPEHPRFSVSL